MHTNILNNNLLFKLLFGWEKIKHYKIFLKNISKKIK